MGKKRLTVIAEPTKEATSVPSASSVPSVIPKPIRKRVRSSRYRRALTKIDRAKTYPLAEAIKLLKQIPLAKFDASVEAHLNLTETNLKVKVAFPHSTGRKLRVAIADDQLLAQIEAGAGKIDFDILLATPQIMPQVAKLAKILGPKGLMPNPKAGTVTADPAKKQAELAGGSRLVSGEPKSPLMHVVIGKLSMNDQELASNIQALVTAVTPKRITKLTLASAMSPGIKVMVQ